MVVDIFSLVGQTRPPAYVTISCTIASPIPAPLLFLDFEGSTVVPLQYQSADDFKGGKALVQVKDGEYALIGRNGERLHIYKYDFVGNRGDRLLAFRQNPNDPYGYFDEQGNVVISPRYTGAQAFRDGRAVVNTAEDYGNKYGLIDKKGAYILEPEYNEIPLLGEQRVAVGKAIDEQRPYIGSIYAIADTNGKFLTDYRFYGVKDYVNLNRIGL